jgi:hypothetical protein
VIKIGNIVEKKKYVLNVFADNSVVITYELTDNELILVKNIFNKLNVAAKNKIFAPSFGIEDMNGNEIIKLTIPHRRSNEN